MPYAELDANGWAVIIAAMFLGIGQIMAMILSYLREQANIARQHVVARKVEEVAEKAGLVAEKVKEVAVGNQKQEDKITALVDKVDDVHRATNGMMQAIKDAEFAKGVKSESEREKKNGGVS